jgi:hypothetical protein
MSTKVVLLKALLTQFKAFLGELRKMYPDDTDFPTFQNALSLLEMNPIAVATYVKEHIVDRHGDKIAQRDESFFLQRSYDEVSDDVNLDVIQKLKGYVLEMDAKTKETVWQYIEIIGKLAVKSLEVD